MHLLTSTAALGLATLAAGYQTGFVNVTATTLWTNPSKPRAVDAPAIACHPDVQKWLDTMTLAQELDLSENSRTQTQALFGARVDILDSKDGWYQVAIPGQLSPDQSLGYPGWVPACQVAIDDFFFQALQDRPFAQVQKEFAPLYADPLLQRKTLDVSYFTRLPQLARVGKAIAVAVPNGIAYLSASDATVFDSAKSIPKPTGEDLINSGKMFIGRPYLWGGRSAWGYDCSGLTGTLYGAHGITIARDAGPEADFTGHGTRVAQSDLQAGDLLFYASNVSDSESIYHVAMYAGDAKMLEAYESGVPVRITDVRFGDDYWGAERYLN